MVCTNVDVEIKSNNNLSVDSVQNTPINVDIQSPTISDSISVDIKNSNPITISTVQNTPITFSLSSTSNPTNFLSLTDTPDSYVGQASNAVTVKSTEDGLEFTSLSKKFNFSAGDWVYTSGDYSLSLNHQLGTTAPNIAILDSNQIIQVNLIEVVDANNVKIWVPGEPDLRFTGTVSMIKT